MEYLVIDVGGTCMKYALMDQDCSFMEKGKIDTPLDKLEHFIEAIGSLYDRYRQRICGIALSMPGVIDSDAGFMYTGGSLTYITNLNILECLKHRCPVRITVENDAKCAALAEVWRGNLCNCDDSIVMVCGTAIGGAVIKDRKVWKGKHFLAGEFSYIKTDAKDSIGLQNLFGKDNGAQRLNQLVAHRTGFSESELDGEIIFHLANCGEEQVIAAIREFCGHLAVQIYNLQFVFDPEKFAIGGGISVQPLFIQLIKEELLEINRSYPWNFPIPEITTCKFFNDSNLIGALWVHLLCENVD